MSECPSKEKKEEQEMAFQTKAATLVQADELISTLQRTFSEAHTELAALRFRNKASLSTHGYREGGPFVFLGKDSLDLRFSNGKTSLLDESEEESLFLDEESEWKPESIANNFDCLDGVGVLAVQKKFFQLLQDSIALLKFRNSFS